VQGGLVELAGDDRVLVTETHRQARERRERGLVDPARDPDFVTAQSFHEDATAAYHAPARMPRVSRSGFTRSLPLTSVLVILLGCMAIMPPGSKDDLAVTAILATGVRVRFIRAG
jgi:hypothetical protein